MSRRAVTLRDRLAAVLLGMIGLGLTMPASGEILRLELADPTAPLTLEVDVAWGQVQVLGQEDASVVVVESLPEGNGDLAALPVEVERFALEGGERIHLRPAALPSGAMRSANLRLRMPRRGAAVVRIERGGDVSVADLEGPVEVTNLNGSVRLTGLSSAAAVNASNGSIVAEFAAVDPARDMIFTSLNGSVELCLPATFSARVQLQTAGDPIHLGFPIAVEPVVRTLAPGEGRQSTEVEIRGQIGESARFLRASTLNGEIRLEPCPRPGDNEERDLPARPFPHSEMILAPTAGEGVAVSGEPESVGRIADGVDPEG
ncbi:MAG: hypothetical protein AAF604_09340 [Acidobacteriota bacterium]